MNRRMGAQSAAQIAKRDELMQDQLVSSQSAMHQQEDDSALVDMLHIMDMKLK